MVEERREREKVSDSLEFSGSPVKKMKRGEGGEEARLKETKKGLDQGARLEQCRRRLFALYKGEV